MKGRAFIDYIWTLRDAHMLLPVERRHLLADAVEEADASFRNIIETECEWVGPSWAMSSAGGLWNTKDVPESAEPDIQRALSYLDRRGLIERKKGEPHMVRFVEK